MLAIQRAAAMKILNRWHYDKKVEAPQNLVPRSSRKKGEREREREEPLTIRIFKKEWGVSPSLIYKGRGPNA